MTAEDRSDNLLELTLKQQIADLTSRLQAAEATAERAMNLTDIAQNRNESLQLALAKAHECIKLIGGEPFYAGWIAEGEKAEGA